MLRFLRSVCISLCLRGRFKTRVCLSFVIIAIVALPALIVRDKCKWSSIFCPGTPASSNTQKGRTIVGRPLSLEEFKALTNKIEKQKSNKDQGSKEGNHVISGSHEDSSNRGLDHNGNEEPANNPSTKTTVAQTSAGSNNHEIYKTDLPNGGRKSEKKKKDSNVEDRGPADIDQAGEHGGLTHAEEHVNAVVPGSMELHSDVVASNSNVEDNGKGTNEEEKVEGKEEDGKEVGQMNAEKMAQALSSGEMCKTVCPPFIWSKWSPCSKACGRGQRFRKAIYKFVCKSSDICPENRLEEEVCDNPCKFDPSKYGGPGGLEMYPVSPLNPPIYPEDRNYMCGHWLVEYQKIHRDILLGKRPPSFLVYSTGKGDYPTAGGLASRIRGITTTFFMAVLLDRAFLIEWSDPPGLEKYLLPKSINWADVSIINSFKRRPPHDIGSWHSAKDKKKSSQWYMDTNFEHYFKHPVEIVQGHRYDFTYALLRNPGLMPKAYELGIDRVKCRICCAFDMLFKMSPTFEKEMGQLLFNIGHPQKPMIAVQVRTKPDDVKKAVVVAEHSINCAQKIAKEKKLKPAIVPIFNNRLVVHILAKKFIKYVKTPVSIEAATRTVHTHLGNLPPDTELAVAQAVQERTFKEFFLMLNSTILIRAKGHMASFGNVADAIHRHYANPNTFSSYTATGSSCDLYPPNFKIE